MNSSSESIVVEGGVCSAAVGATSLVRLLREGERFRGSAMSDSAAFLFRVWGGVMRDVSSAPSLADDETRTSWKPKETKEQCL